MENKAIKYPYLPEGRSIGYVSAENEYMAAAKAFAAAESKDNVMPGAAVLVKDGTIIARGANGSDYHELHGCERIRQGIPTGQGYELCEGCHPKNHSEPSAIADAVSRDEDTRGADLYLWGHWWFCESCWDAMIAAGIRNVYLLEHSEVLFNKAHPGNSIGRQFE
jgi:deoxycytidylate deaminase